MSTRGEKQVRTRGSPGAKSNSGPGAGAGAESTRSGAFAPVAPPWDRHCSQVNLVINSIDAALTEVLDLRKSKPPYYS